MNIDEIYGMVPGVMTPEEEEDWHHDPCDDIIDTTPSWYRMKMLMHEPMRTKVRQLRLEAQWTKSRILSDEPRRIKP